MYKLLEITRGAPWPAIPGWYRSFGHLSCCADGCGRDIKINRPMWLTGTVGDAFCAAHASQVGASALSETVSDC